MGLSACLTSLLPLANLLGIPVRGALTSGSRQLASKFKRMYSPNLGGAQLYISCDVTKTGGKFRLTNAFQSTLGFSFVCVIVVAKSTPPWAQSENCFYYESPEMRASATVFTTHLIKWPPEEGLEQKECCHTHREAWGLSRGQGRPGHQRWHSTCWRGLVPLSFVFHCANHKPAAGGRLTLLYHWGTVRHLDTHSVTLTQWLRNVLWQF